MSESRFFVKWYKPEYRMDRADWLFVAYMLIGSLLAFGSGLVIGLLWTRFL